MSYIPQFGDANTYLAGDAVSPAGDVDVSAGDAHLHWETTASPGGDLLASPNFGICDTTRVGWTISVVTDSNPGIICIYIN